MNWKALLLIPNHNSYDRWLIQTDTHKLYPIKVNPNTESRKEIARHIAKIANIPLGRIVFQGEKRRRDKLIVYDYLVMHDDIEPPF